MGEYARLRGSGERVKIGTCEDLLYLRFDQLDRIQRAAFGSDDTDPRNALNVFRFRFPFPDEDGVDPGAFDDPFRRVSVYGVSHPEGVDHGRLQFRHDHGYLVWHPCPEGVGDVGELEIVGDGGRTHAYKVHRNGFKGSAFISQQKVFEGRLVTVAECACGAKYRLETLEMAEPWLVCIREMADQRAAQLERDQRVHGPDVGDSQITRLRMIADRMEAGYSLDLGELAHA